MGIVVINSGGPGKHQRAMNDAAELAIGKYLAFLEDDDVHLQAHLLACMKVARLGVPFVGCSQLNVKNGTPICVFDFPTASGWFVEKHFWEEFGGVDESYEIHHDNALCCKLLAAKVKCAHLIEKGAHLTDDRRWLLDRITKRAIIIQTDEWTPQVLREVHEGSIMSGVGVSAERAARSKMEKDRLRAEFGSEGY
jgi:hypothetical protein